MSPATLLNPSHGRRLPALMSKRALPLLVLCFGWAISAAAQGPACTLTLSPPSGTAPLLVTATGGCTDASTIASEVLDWGDGNQTTIPASSFLAFTEQHTYTAAGTFTVSLTAVDAASAQTTVTQQEVVTPNAPPTCNLSVTPMSGTPPLNVTASGSCTDPENDITSTVITWGDGTSATGTSGPHTYNNVGIFTVKLTATDVAGNTGSATQTVTVTNNQPPTCTLQVTPSSGPAPLPVTATGSCTDPENDITSTVLNWSDGTTSNGTSGTHTFTATGTFVVTLTATDVAGNIGKASQTVTVGNGHNVPPTCSLTVSPVTGQVPFSVTINPNCSDPEHDITSIMVDFGDSFYASVAPGATATHVFTRAGSFKTTVTATDAAGNVSNPSAQTETASDTPTMFVGISNGQLKQFDQSGKALKTLNTNQGGSITGMAFDWLDSLYVTDFSADAVSKLDGSGTLVGNFGFGYNCKPESIVFDNAGNAYIGETGCSHALLKFDTYGNLAAAYSVATEVEGSDWIDLASDQCTIYYTSQGTKVFRFNACTGQQQPPFATGLGTGLAVKILPDQSVLVADKADIIHFDSGGRVIGKYTAAGESCWVSLALDPDGQSFWAVDYCSSDVIRFDINSGDQLAKFNSGSASQTVFGIAMRGAAVYATPAGPLIASPQSATVAVGQTASLNVAFVPSGSAVNQSFTFSCGGLPVGAACHFSPQTATVTASGITVNVAITTTAAAARIWNVFAPRFLAWWAIWAGVLFAGEIRVVHRHCRRRTWAVAFLLLALAALIACSASSSSSGGSAGNGNNTAPTAVSTTPAGNYTVVLHATSSNLQSSTLMNLTVQ